MSVDTGQTRRKTNADLERLVRLQKVDIEIQRKTRLADVVIPAEINRFRAGYEGARDRLGAFDEEVNGLNAQRRELEREADQTRDAMAKAKQKLPEVKTNVEYRAILKELDNFEKKIVGLDDRQLEIMEAVEDKSGDRKSLEEAAAGEKEKFDAVRVEKEAAIGDLREAIGRLRAERDAIVARITPEIFSSYERVSRQRDGIGVTQVIERSCQACHQLIPPQLYYQVRTTEDIYQCPHCNRYLYYEPSQEAESG